MKENPQPRSEARRKKIARLWMLAKECAVDSTHLHVIVESVTGKYSITTLTMRELDSSIAALEAHKKRMLAAKKRSIRQTADSRMAYLPTPAQREMVTDIMARLALKLGLNYPEAYLDSICRRHHKKNYNRLNRRELITVIEAIKAIDEREKGENNAAEK